jgi:four helix bundle protein
MERRLAVSSRCKVVGRELEVSVFSSSGRQWRWNDGMGNGLAMKERSGCIVSASMQDFRRLSVWRRAHALALDIQRLTRDVPRRDNAGLISQMRRAATSIPANIAEGCGRESNRDLAKFLQIAVASASELEYHLLFCADASLVSRAEFDKRHGEVVQVRRMLIGLLKKVRAAPSRPIPTTGS